MTSDDVMLWDDASQYCQDQHSSGLVTWDSDEKYLDVKFIVGIGGEHRQGYTALYNPNQIACNQATCSGQLVTVDLTQLRYISNYFN